MARPHALATRRERLQDAVRAMNLRAAEHFAAHSARIETGRRLLDLREVGRDE